MADKEVYYATGRRKTSVARVYMTKGKGVFTVNKKPMDEYFGRETSSMIINQPLDVVEMHKKFDFNILVKGGVEIARDFNVSEAVIGLTIIAVGTSLPELVTAIIALKKNHGEVALGNVIGSNIFNLFAIMGGTALVADVPVPASFLSIDLWVMLISSAALLPFVIWKIKLNRITGLIFCSGYIIYLFTLSNSS